MTVVKPFRGTFVMFVILGHMTNAVANSRINTGGNGVCHVVMFVIDVLARSARV